MAAQPSQTHAASAGNALSLLSGNALKLIAAAAMLVDHIGVMFFPRSEIFRIIGRLALPIFAFMIAEGCKYTRNKARYFFTIAGLAVLCQIVYYLFDNSLYMCILVTFSLSILVIYALQNLKAALFSENFSLIKTLFASAVFAASVWAVWVLNRHFTIDYGFWGCMLPVFASLFQNRKHDVPSWLKKLDCKEVHVLALTVGAFILAIDRGGVQHYSFQALPLLLCYSGKRGKWNLKYFFYIFYPLHLAALEGIYLLLM